MSFKYYRKDKMTGHTAAVTRRFANDILSTGELPSNRDRIWRMEDAAREAADGRSPMVELTHSHVWVECSPRAFVAPTEENRWAAFSNAEISMLRRSLVAGYDKAWKGNGPRKSDEDLLLALYREADDEMSRRQRELRAKENQVKMPLDY